MRIVSAIAHTLTSGFKPVLGIYPWFIIKIQLSYQLHLAYAKGQLPNLSHTKQQYTKTFKSKAAAIKNLISLLKMAVKLWRTHLKLQLSDYNLLAVGYTVHNKVFNDQNKSIYLQPHINDLKPKSAFMYYLDTTNNEVERQYLKQLLNFFTLYYKLRLWCSGSKQQQLKGYGKDINKQLQTDIKQPIEGLEQFIAERIMEYKVHYRAYKYWLKKVKPQTVIGYCYYDNRINALFGAANSLGITTIECQHSAISNNHFAYAKWEMSHKLTPHFPAEFYVWTAADKQIITQNFSAHNYTPTITVKGIKHISYNKPTTKSVSTNNILICLQGIWMPKWLEDFIVEDKKYNWYIRLHPRYPNDKKQLKKMEALQKPNLFVQEANTKSLEELLQQSETMVTCFSGTALEAHAYNLKVLIYGEEGKNTYSEYISKGEFFYVDSVESISYKLKTN